MFRAELEAFYRGRRILITGHTGFKGAWLVTWLRQLGAEVYGYSLAAGTPSLWRLLREPGVVEVVADIRDADALARFVAETAPDLVFHLAAQALVLEGYRDPSTTFSTNLLGLVHLLDLVPRTASPRAVVVATSDKCYAEPEDPSRPHIEADPLGGTDPYSASKAAAELIAASYRNAWATWSAPPAIGLATARAGNVIGGGDFASDRLVPDLARANFDLSRLRLRLPDARRPWQHVLDVLHGYLILGARVADQPAVYGEAWNFAPEPKQAIPVRELVERLAGQSLPASATEPGLIERSTLRLDASKARNRLRWRPMLGIDEVIGWTRDWYLAAASPDTDVRALCHGQLRAYESLLETRGRA